MPFYVNKASVKTGTVDLFLQSAAPLGYVIANGGLLSRAAYPALWTYAQASGNIAATDAAWAAGMYSPGDGATTFRIPELRGEFLRFADSGRGVDSGRVVGTFQDHQMQQHSHTVGGSNTDTGSTFTNGINRVTTNLISTGVAGGTSNGSENRPRNVALLPCIKT